MKFEELLIEEGSCLCEGLRRRRLALHEEVPLLQLLLAELDAVEEEILYLERRLSSCLCFPEHPNTISEELLRSLMAVFLTCRAPPQRETAPHLQGLSSCIITSSSSRSRSRSAFCLNIGSYKGRRYTHITRGSFSNPNTSHIPQISVLLKKLCYVDLAFLNYKQKLAFWINVYNACIMNAYLQNGIPSTQEKMLTLLIKATVNVGGIVLNALAIEHYILRHPHKSKLQGLELKDVGEDVKEMLVRGVYGLQYPEPNVTFGLCRGNWSSPAVKVYSSEAVVSELEMAKVEYLEAWVGVKRSRKKIVIVVPKLVRWHICDFAGDDDLESLVEWIYSQLPHNAVKTRIMECLMNSHIKPMVEILPYHYDFRYLIPTPLHKP